MIGKEILILNTAHNFKTNIFESCRSTDNLVIVILILYYSNPLIINSKSLSNVFFVNTIK